MIYYTLFANICQVKYVVNYNYEDSSWVSLRISCQKLYTPVTNWVFALGGANVAFSFGV